MPHQVNRDPNVNWRDDQIQFPRLIAELEAAGAFTPEVMRELAENMDLPHSAIAELVERAQTRWDEIKQCTLTP